MIFWVESVSLVNAQAGVIISGTVHSERSRAIVMIADNIEGTVETVLDTRGAITLGITLGLVWGFISFLSRLKQGR